MRQTLPRSALFFALFSVISVPAQAQSNADFILNIPVRIAGDATKVTDGIWIGCTVTRGSYAPLTQSYTVALPGDVMQPTEPDGTHVARLPWTVPDYMKGAAVSQQNGFNWFCTIYQGSPQTDLSLAKRFAENDRPIDPADYGSCTHIRGALNADFSQTIEPGRFCLGDY
ncbi:hypothetical protein [Phaeobacter sp.]|uniref:hypothetical protein n=1 Tax=Phaeobacter sp. TaxID=1902409 RepID=UPI0025DD7588|nr:hypothetical protein [Phaeobacter sp.]